MARRVASAGRDALLKAPWVSLLSSYLRIPGPSTTRPGGVNSTPGTGSLRGTGGSSFGTTRPAVPEHGAWWLDGRQVSAAMWTEYEAPTRIRSFGEAREHGLPKAWHAFVPVGTVPRHRLPGLEQCRILGRCFPRQRRPTFAWQSICGLTRLSTD